MEPTTIARNCKHGVKVQLITSHHRNLPNLLMVLPDEVVGPGADGNDGNMHTSMYVDSSYYQ